MRDLSELEVYRLRGPRVKATFGTEGDKTSGIFKVPNGKGAMLKVIASAGYMGWDHVSVSLSTRCPSWEELEIIKRLFFKDDETAMQLHVPPSEHVNYHPYCLHLWRPCEGEIPRPPSILVGPSNG